MFAFGCWVLPLCRHVKAKIESTSSAVHKCPDRQEYPDTQEYPDRKEYLDRQEPSQYFAWNLPDWWYLLSAVYVFQNRIYNIYINLGHVNHEMFCELVLSSKSFVALVALERLLPSVHHHVALQVARFSTSVVALVTLIWLFPCMVHHHVSFQFTSSYAGKLAHRAPVRLFPRVGPFVLFQIVWLSWSIVALIALMWFLPSVFHFVVSQIGNMIGWKVALCALVRFLPSVNEEVPLQTDILAKWLVALGTVVCL